MVRQPHAAAARASQLLAAGPARDTRHEHKGHETDAIMIQSNKKKPEPLKTVVFYLRTCRDVLTISKLFLAVVVQIDSKLRLMCVTPNNQHVFVHKYNSADIDMYHVATNKLIRSFAGTLFCKYLNNTFSTRCRLCW